MRNEFQESRAPALKTSFAKRTACLKQLPSSATNFQIAAGLGITFEVFVKYLTRIEEYIKFSNKLYEIGIDISNFAPDEMCAGLIELLENIFGDDRNHWISFFIYNLDFGHREEARAIEVGERTIELTSAAALWGLLLNEIRTQL